MIKDEGSAGVIPFSGRKFITYTHIHNAGIAVKKSISSLPNQQKKDQVKRQSTLIERFTYVDVGIFDGIINVNDRRGSWEMR